MNFYEQQFRRMFDEECPMSEIVYVGRTMIGKLGDDLIAKISFETDGKANNYPALKLSIINREDGEVDSQMFRFGDILSRRSLSDSTIDVHAWEYRGRAEWFGYTPLGQELESIGDTVSEYMALYLKHDIDMSFE